MCVKFNGPADMPSRTPLQGRLLAARDRVHRRKSYPVTDAPCAPLRCVRSAVAHPTQWCGTGGYIIRPYGPACGPLVGAACMAARNQVPIRAGVRWFPSAVGARIRRKCMQRGSAASGGYIIRPYGPARNRRAQKYSAEGCHCAVGITGNTKGGWRLRRPAGRRR